MDSAAPSPSLEQPVTTTRFSLSDLIALFCVRIGLMGQKWVESATVIVDHPSADRLYRIGQKADSFADGLVYK